ncbi:MAG: hypothetical protein ABIN89_30195 [Chitinophagaceae bacterium]
MRIIMVLILVLIKNSGYSQTNNSYSPKPDYDIDVIGGTPAGVAASVGFARCNKPETTQ